MIACTDGGLRVSAPMVIANARALLAAGRSCLRAREGAALTVLDLSEVGEVDSSAVSLILAWLRTAGERNLELRISNPPASLISLAALYGVAELLPLA
ncbi:MAG: putative NTP binding protein (contains STAS domain) [Candidatus Accumulibacter sp. BA-94]|jgi:phospholipid transport system transporter-binding protein|uniref:STAS domain-containing protein n=1 Tax=Accumulibacter sp. TaxID=2053492 RepID=UPI000452E2C4|nr:STAS domain-containing protein [Accumulibacter sp.]EXI80330.1 MAG: putative NTP binding protein (contains STAS domain) [Candidatus Accumulibacter sp. BA-94]MBL8390872.1 STAS domain-containing protein [Accumulibacter sp.]HRD89189.1 STAS domain-containing protein [Accumulibacter sp.]